MAGRADGRRHARPARLPQHSSSRRGSHPASRERRPSTPPPSWRRRSPPRGRKDGFPESSSRSCRPPTCRSCPDVDPLLRAAAWLLIAVVGLVLLLACTNLASFLVARALDRNQEVAVRRALGATRGALARQVLVESALLGLGGAAAGLVLALVLLDVLLSIDLPLPYGMRLDLHFGLGWTTLLRLASAGVHRRRWRDGGRLLSDSFPAVRRHARRSRLGAEGGQQREAMRPGLSGGATRWSSRRSPCRSCCSWARACSCRSWQQTLAVDPGFGRAPTSVLSVIMPATRSAPEAALQRTRRLLERFRTLPGARAAGPSGRCRCSRRARPTSPSTAAGRRLAARRFAPRGRRWTADTSTPPA